MESVIGMTATEEPRLGPPGAGLPALELFVARCLFSLKRRLLGREEISALFERERGAIRALVAQCAVGARGDRVLIDRVRGLEDSSRFWSVWMTLDHLRITNSAFTSAISALAGGMVPKRKASTAAVKPDSGVTQAVEQAHEEACERFVAAVAAVPDLRTEATYAHPWFGELNAAGWHLLAAVHMGVHRRQLQRIVRALPR